MPFAQMSERQRKIVEYVQKIPQAKISDFHAFFSGVSLKTIQRDLHDLVERNILKKDGEKRWTMYSLK
jgi:DeoR/GlpR family transcriptional regulator of sugar metabolism